MDNAKRSALENAMNDALDRFSEEMNSKNAEYSENRYNEDAIIMMDALAKQTHELAASFRDAILEALS